MTNEDSGGDDGYSGDGRDDADDDGTPRINAFLPCGHLDFESAITARNGELNAVFIDRKPGNSIRSLDTY